MKNHNHLTNEMKHFLVGVRDFDKSLSELMTEQKITPSRLARWLRSAAFWDTARSTLREKRVRNRLMLEMLFGAMLKDADERRQDAANPPTEAMVRLYEVIGAVALKYRQMYRRRGGGRGGARGTVLPPADLCHPSAKERELELLAALASPVEAGEEVRTEALPVLTVAPDREA